MSFSHDTRFDENSNKNHNVLIYSQFFIIIEFYFLHTNEYYKNNETVRDQYFILRAHTHQYYQSIRI